MFERLYDRSKIIVHQKYKETSKENNIISHLTKIDKNKKELDYEYYKCDFCHKEIKITNNKHERSGGTVTFPASLTKRRPLELVLHNKCLNPAKRTFEEVHNEI